MSDIHIDFETRSVVDIKKSGVHVYAENDYTEPLCLAYAIDDGDIKLWKKGDNPPSDLFTAMALDDAFIYAHNMAFEKAIWHHTLHKRFLWPDLPAQKLRCTLAMAYASALPGSLEAAAKVLSLPIEKDMDGRRAMLQLSKPRKYDDAGLPIWWEDADKLEALYSYCKKDVAVERELTKRLRPLSAGEQALWLLDQKINDAGVFVDTIAAQRAIDLVAREKQKLDAEMATITEGRITSCTQSVALRTWCADQGVHIAGVGKADVRAALKEELSEPVHQALLLRQEAAKASTAKLVAMLEGAGTDGRVRGTMQYHGASTGRWAGRRVQPQNLPRPSLLSQSQIEDTLALLGNKAIPLEQVSQWIHVLFGSPLSVLSDCLRGFIRAPEGHDLVSIDYANIEGRALAWLAGQTDKIEAFEAFDRGEGPDLYKVAAAGIYGVAVADVTSDQRQMGKVAELACGYQGSVGAFQAMASAYGLAIPDEQAMNIVSAWRATNPNIKAYWSQLQMAALDAIQAPSKIFLAGAQGRQAAFKKVGEDLFCRLPSGRCLSYHAVFTKKKSLGNNPETLEVKDVTGREDEYRARGWDVWKSDIICHTGVDSVTKKWTQKQLYGGLLAENVTQALCRDILAQALLRLDKKGYKVVMHVHDEIVVEVEKGVACFDDISAIMREPPPWAKGLPIATSGWAGERYQK